MATNENSSKTEVLAERSTAQKERLFAELALELLGNAPPGRPIPVCDADGILQAYLMPLNDGLDMLSMDVNSPAFYEELRRRCRHEPTLTVDEFLALLKSPH